MERRKRGRRTSNDEQRESREAEKQLEKREEKRITSLPSLDQRSKVQEVLETE
jgi:hypothetical protein